MCFKKLNMFEYIKLSLCYGKMVGMGISRVLKIFIIFCEIIGFIEKKLYYRI